MYPSLKRSAEFDDVLRGGVRHRRGGVIVFSKPGPGDAIRVGLVTSRRIGPAVVRNRVKRRLRAAFWELALPPGTDYVVIGTRKVADIPFGTLCEWLSAATPSISSKGQQR